MRGHSVRFTRVYVLGTCNFHYARLSSYCLLELPLACSPLYHVAACAHGLPAISMRNELSIGGICSILALNSFKSGCICSKPVGISPHRVCRSFGIQQNSSAPDIILDPDDPALVARYDSFVDLVLCPHEPLGFKSKARIHTNQENLFSRNFTVRLPHDHTLVAEIDLLKTTTKNTRHIF